MTRLELLMILYALQAFLEDGKPEKALELINKVIAEAEKS